MEGVSTFLNVASSVELLVQSCCRFLSVICNRGRIGLPKDESKTSPCRRKESKVMDCKNYPSPVGAGKFESLMNDTHFQEVL